MNDNMFANPFDMETMTSPPSPLHIAAIKAALPHLEPKHRRLFGVMAKIMELREMTAGYGDSAHMGGDPRAALMAMRPFVTDECGRFIDMILRVRDMRDATGGANVGGMLAGMMSGGMGGMPAQPATGWGNG